MPNATRHPLPHSVERIEFSTLFASASFAMGACYRQSRQSGSRALCSPPISITNGSARRQPCDGLGDPGCREKAASCRRPFVGASLRLTTPLGLTGVGIVFGDCQHSVILEEPRGSGATKNLVVGRAFQLVERLLPRFFVPMNRDSRMTVYVEAGAYLSTVFTYPCQPRGREGVPSPQGRRAG
jgi:hypothetical protein